jgi:pimeloyl-ACP methyl ester carboxylesterase
MTSGQKLIRTLGGAKVDDRSCRKGPFASLAEHWADVAGIKTRYVSAGQGDPILFLHGGCPGDPIIADDAHIWTPAMERLSSSYRCIAVDRLGQGQTDNPPLDGDYAVDGMVAHVRQFVADLGLGPVHIVGHEVAGLVAMRLCLEAPELLRSLTIVNSNAAAPELGLAELVQTANPYTEGSWEYARWAVDAISHVREHLSDEELDRRRSLVLSAKHQAAYQRVFATGVYENTFLISALKANEISLEHLQNRPLNRPVFLIWGYDDPTSPVEQAYALYDVVSRFEPRAQLHVLNGAGHYPFRERPVQFARALTDFLQDCRHGV